MFPHLIENEQKRNIVYQYNTITIRNHSDRKNNFIEVFT